MHGSLGDIGICGGLTLLVAALRPQLADLACDAAGTGPRFALSFGRQTRCDLLNNIESNDFKHLKAIYCSFISSDGRSCAASLPELQRHANAAPPTGTGLAGQCAEADQGDLGHRLGFETQDKHGCLVIQEALESATREMQMPIMSELKGKVSLVVIW